MDIESLLSLFLVAMVVVGGGGIAVMFTIRNLLFISGPNEVLVFSGASDTDGRGYVTVKGGRRVRVPIIERVSRIDLTNMTVDVSVTNAYSKGGIPLTVQGVANLKIAFAQKLLEEAEHDLHPPGLGAGHPQDPERERRGRLPQLHRA